MPPRPRPAPEFTQEEVRDISRRVYELRFDTKRDFAEFLAERGEEKVRALSGQYDALTRAYLRVIRGSATEAAPARRAEAGEKVAHQAEEFLDHLEKRWPEVTDMDHWRDALLEAIAELRMLPDRNNSLEQPHAS